MVVNDGVRETHACVAERGPVSVKEIADRTVTSASTVKGRLRAMEREGFVDSVANFPERLYIVGPARLPAKGPTKRAPARPVPDASEVAAMRERVHELALDRGLEVTVVAAAGFRLSVPHPFGQGRVWVDTPGDLEAVLIEMELGPIVEDEIRAAA